jgi:hypothetical protein
MIQDILTYTFILVAVGMIIYRTVRLFTRTKQTVSGDCCSSGGCHDCNLKDIDSGIRYHQIKHPKITDPVVIAKN